MTKKQKKVRRNSRGSVMFICFLLLGSAAVRIGSEAGKAVATETPTDEEVRSEAEKPISAPRLDQDGMTRMLAAFEEREARVEQLERDIEQRKKALEVADQEITERLLTLEEAEATLRSMLSVADTAAEQDVQTLTAVYENMKPKDAAALFEEMEPAFAAGFLGRMRPEAAAGIMAGLSPQTAYTISVILAGRNAEVPPDNL